MGDAPEAPGSGTVRISGWRRSKATVAIGRFGSVVAVAGGGGGSNGGSCDGLVDGGDLDRW